ncbi:MAG TPA: GNAT family N-acetyltransferase [Vibrio sp.]|uniref:GNAT family N-acetyltransferase n=1 Tax=Vibrio TaxID=662 RepID=UPI0004864630|nr:MULTISPECIES: GNAT family N-acetyltransferase [Vibrio]HCH01898.1 GNAT family N-acetyltransferase [Vibrio sp.]
MKIRHLEESDHQDLHGIYSFREVLINTSQLPCLSSSQVSNLFDSPNQYTLVAEVGGKVVGHVTLFLTTKIRDKHTAGIAIAVHPDNHGAGIGKTLMSEAIDQADNWLNLVRIELEVHSDNPSAQALYEKVGFRVEGIKRLSTFKYGKYIDMILMSRINPVYDVNT